MVCRHRPQGGDGDIAALGTQDDVAEAKRSYGG
jgi:hypothetical protein